VPVNADTVFIRAYEDRMDLLRAVMVGVTGTPYHDGLFFFDMQLSAAASIIIPHHAAAGELQVVWAACEP
jgi:hypothetical protein